MKKGTKKVLSISGAILGVGAIATSITLPIVLSSTARSALDDDKVLYYDENGKPLKFWNGHEYVVANVKNVLEWLKRMGQEDRTQLNRFDYYSAFFIYNQEQEKSLILQKMWFQWNIYDFNKQIEDVQNGGGDQKEIDKKVKELNDKKAKEQEKLDLLIKVIKKETSDSALNYNSGSFKSSYPKILLPLENRKKESEKKYNEAKNNLIDKYPTRREGEIAWEMQRRKEYNDAANDAEAIDWMTSNDVSKDAFGQFNFKINGEYTLAQKMATVKEDGQEHAIFPFLQTAYQKKRQVDDKDNDSYLKTKVWFIGSESKDPEKIVLDLNSNSDLTKNILAKISDQKLLRVSQGLLKVKQNESGANLNWSFGEKDKEGDTLFHLLSFYGNDQQGIKGRVYKDLLPKVFADDTTEQGRSITNAFIDNYSDDTNGKNIQGSLGVQTMLYYLKEMEPGFGLGVLAKVLNNPQGDNYLETLSTNIQKAIDEVWPDNPPKNQDELTSFFPQLTSEQKQKFGWAFKNTFDPDGKGLQLVYPAGPNAAIVFSKIGMHIIRTEDFSDINKLKADIGNDLQTVANSQKIKDSKTQWGDLFSKYFKDNQRRQFIKDNFNKDKQLENYINEQEKKRTEEQKRINWDSITKTIDALNIKQKITNVDEALGDKVKDFYIQGIDKGLLQKDPLLLPQDVKKKLLEYIIPAFKNGGGK